MSPEQYARHLVEEGLNLDQEARQRSFAELSIPFQRALGSLSDAQIDALVDEARTKHHRREGRLRRRR
jgi:hypothetical protein